MEQNTMSTPTNPFEELEEWFDKMSNQFEEITGAEPPALPAESAGNNVTLDLIERDGEYEATVDLPGFDPEDIDVEVTERALQIAAKHEETREEDEDTYLTRERHTESLRRSLRLPTAVDPGNVSAEMQNGVLTITLPKSNDGGTSVEIE